MVNSFLSSFPRNLLRYPRLTIMTAFFIMMNFLSFKSYLNSMNRKKLKFKIDGRLISCRGTDLVILSDVFLVEEYSLLKPDKNSIVFDIGANIGSYSVKMAGDAGKIISFEPSPGNITLLKENLLQNNIENVELVEKAVSNSNESIDFFVGKSNSGVSSVFEHVDDMTKIKVKTIKLDDFVTKSGLDLKDKKIIIKMDVEGSELNVLKGAVNVLKRENIEIMMETHPSVLDPKLVEGFLEKMGFEVTKINYSQPFIFAKK